MVSEESDKEKVRQIVQLLPRVNCGHCGFGNCGGFALAVVRREVSPYGCEVHPLAGDEICKVLGIEVPEEAKVTAGYSRSGRVGILTGAGVRQGRHSGFGRHGGHHRGHHGHGLGHDGGRRNHHHRRHFL